MAAVAGRICELLAVSGFVVWWVGGQARRRLGEWVGRLCRMRVAWWRLALDSALRRWLRVRQPARAWSIAVVRLEVHVKGSVEICCDLFG